MSHIHEELEVGRELDQALRTAVTAVAQMMERVARRATDSARAQTSAVRDEARRVEQQARGAGPGSDAQAQAQTARRDGQTEARRELIDQVGAARAAYGPWTSEGKVERGDRVAASKAWSRAAGWSEQDERAADAERNLRERIEATFGVHPAQILASVDPEHGHPTGVAAGRLSMREAADLADKYSPYYYQGTAADMFGRVGNRPVNPAQERFVADWQEWARTGSLPHETLTAAWAQHTGDTAALDAGAFTGPDGALDRDAQVAALEQVWEQGRADREQQEYAGHLQQLRDAGKGTEAVRVAAGEREDSAVKARAWEPLLDPATFGQADGQDTIAAWRAAASAAAADPTDRAAAAAAAQLATRIQTVHGRDVGLYLADAVSDQQIARTDARRRAEDAARETQAAPATISTAQAPSAAADRGVAPNKARTPQEREHRVQAWRDAEQQFGRTLPAGTTAAQARAAWGDMPEADRYARYWAAYDASTAAADSVAQEAPAALPAAVAAAPRQSTEQSVSRERVLELNSAAAQFYSQQLQPGTPGHQYLTERLGQDAVSSGPWSLGYAPDGWNGLARHLRSQTGASDEEIVGAGLGRVSSRGSVIDAFRNRAMVAIKDTDGAVVGFYGRDLSGDERSPKHLNSGTTAAYTKGDHVFGLHEAPAGARLARTEATFDAIALTQASEGQLWGVAPMGTAMTDTQAAAIAARATVDGKVWLANDGDDAGQRATDSDFWRLVEHGADPRSVAIPRGQDPAGLWREDPDLLRLAAQYPETHPSAALDVLEHAVDADQAGLRGGDADAFDRVDMAERDLHGALRNDVDRSFLSSHTQSLLDGLREQEAAQRTEAARLQEVEATLIDAAERDQDDPERRQALEDAATGVEAREDSARERGDQLAGQVAQAGDDAPYNRAQESDVTNLSPAARRVAVGTAHGYSQSTTDMLNAANKGSDAWKAKQSSQATGLGQSRIKGVRR